MSIAQDEANTMFRFANDAYVSGRTAAVTQAEVEAAGGEVCAALLEEHQRARMIVDGLTVKSVQSNPLIVTFSNGARLHVDRLTILVLDAAREKVME